MDYALAICRNRDQIRTIVLALFALAGLRPHRSLPVGPDGRPQLTLSRSIFAMIMLVLRPAESCVRRLIFIAAHGLKPPASVSSSTQPGWRERKLHEIDDVLRECHGLAHDRLNAP